MYLENLTRIAVPRAKVRVATAIEPKKKNNNLEHSNPLINTERESNGDNTQQKCCNLHATYDYFLSLSHCIGRDIEHKCIKCMYMHSFCSPVLLTGVKNPPPFFFFLEEALL